MRHTKGVQADSSPVGEGLFSILISYFLLYIFLKAFGWLITPFRSISKSEIEGDLREKIGHKQRQRKFRYEAISSDENDPMFQFYERNVQNPERYKGDADNQYYKDWFLQWKQGKILDSNLRWAPPVYNDDDMQPNFLMYLNHQINMHQNQSILKKATLLGTIRRFYPEFESHSLKAVKEDIELYACDVERSKTEEAIRKEIEEFGLSEYFANFLIKEVASEDINKVATRIKKALEYDYEDSTCEYIAMEGIEPDSKFAVIIDKVLSEIGLDPKVGHMYAQGRLTIGDLKDLREFIDQAQETLGIAMYAENEEGIVPYQELVKEKLRQYCRKQLV